MPPSELLTTRLDAKRHPRGPLSAPYTVTHPSGRSLIESRSQPSLGAVLELGSG
jgi:hypothetical protein